MARYFRDTLGNFYSETASANWNITGTGNSEPVDMSGSPDRTVQVSGTFGGTTISIQGSNDNSVWHGLSFVGGMPAIFTNQGIGVLLEAPSYIRVVASGGSGIAVLVTVAGSQ